MTNYRGIHTHTQLTSHNKAAMAQTRVEENTREEETRHSATQWANEQAEATLRKGAWGRERGAGV